MRTLHSLASLFPVLPLPGAEEQDTLAGFLSSTCFLLMAEQSVPHTLTSGGQESEAEHYATVWTLMGSGGCVDHPGPRGGDTSVLQPQPPLLPGEVRLPVPGEARVLKGNLNPFPTAAQLCDPLLGAGLAAALSLLLLPRTPWVRVGCVTLPV